LSVFHQLPPSNGKKGKPMSPLPPYFCII